MANWKLYLYDYAPEATTVTGTNISGASNVANGFPSSLATFTSTSGTLTFAFASSVIIRAMAFFNLGGMTGATATLKRSTTTVGAVRTFASDADILWDQGDGITGGTGWSIEFASTHSGDTIGEVSLLVDNTGYYITFTDTGPYSPMGFRQYSVASDMTTIGGVKIRQRRGGTGEILTLSIPRVQLNGNAGTEGYLDDIFGSKANPAYGFTRACWLVDDNGGCHYGYLGQSVLDWQVNNTGVRADLQVTFEGLPKIGSS